MQGDQDHMLSSIQFGCRVKVVNLCAILSCDPMQSVQCKLGMSESGEGAVECRGGEEISGLTTTCLMHCSCNTLYSVTLRPVSDDVRPGGVIKLSLQVSIQLRG